MSSLAPKSSKPSKFQSHTSSSSTTSNPSRSSSLATHLAMVELKQKILTSLSKLSDRDTHQIAIDDLEKTIQSLSPDSLPMLLNCLYDASSSDPKTAVRKESIRLLALLSTVHSDLIFTHLTKIVSHIVKRLKDSDSGVREACKDAIGVLSGRYLKNEGVVGLFVKPLFEAMGEQNKGVQLGAGMCMAKMVECALDPPVPLFQKLCPRICKLLGNQNFLGKAALLTVVASLAQVRAIAPQSVEPLLRSVHECLGSPDWATRKAAADVLSGLALYSRNLIANGADSTLAILESCRFDKIKPVRESMTEALELWKKIAGKGGDETPDEHKDGENSESADLPEKIDQKISNPNERRTGSSSKDSSNGSSPTSDSVSKTRNGILDKAVVILKKKALALTDKELNPEFFQKLETRGSGDFPVEVVVSRRCRNSSNMNVEEESEPTDSNSRGRLNCIGNSKPDDSNGSFSDKCRNIERGSNDVYSKQYYDESGWIKFPEERVNEKDSRMRAFDVDSRIDSNQRESSGNGFSKIDGQSEGSFISNRGNWLAIQRQLLQLERQQAHIMNMLQDFMGGSHNSMLTLENRVRGLERVVEDMAQDLSSSSGRRGSSFAMGFEGSSNRPLGKYNGFPDYSGAKFGRSGDGRVPFGERFTQSDGTASGMRGRDPPWRSDTPDAWDFATHGASKNGQMYSRRMVGGGSIDGRSPKSERDSDHGGGRRAWEKGTGPVRFGEGPSARSVWQASKDEATLEAIRVAGEDSGTSRTARIAVPELTAEALGDDNVGQERDPLWTSWSNAMDALHAGDMDSAYAEVVSTGDDVLLVKIMDKTGPVIEQLSDEIASEVFHAVVQFLLDQSLFDICLSWIQQLVDVVLENGPDVLGIPMEVKRELLMNLHEASSAMDTPDDWEGTTPDQLLLQLASAWVIDLQQFK